jgi:UDP-glucose 4-epimerase
MYATLKLKNIFASHEFSAVIHFVGREADGESIEKLLVYYSVNTAGTLALC